MMKRTFLGISALFVSFLPSFCLGQNITVQNNLVGLFERLCSADQSVQYAIICNPFITRYDILKKAVQQGIRTYCIAQEDYLLKYYESDVADPEKQHIVGYSANVHDKIAVLVDKQGTIEGFVGSANFSESHFLNTELVLHIPNTLRLPGFMQHIAKLSNKARIYQTLRYPGTSIPQLPEGPKTSRTTPRGSCTQCELISSFDFEEDTSYGLIAWIADQIKVNEKHTYLISTMTLNHPAFLRAITKAVTYGSSFKIIIDKNTLLKKPQQFPILHLMRLAKKYPDRITIRWKHGLALSGFHHAKLLIRPSDETTVTPGISIVSTANFTIKGDTQTNCALALPHDDGAHQSIITTLEETFYKWWDKAENIPSFVLKRTGVDDTHHALLPNSSKEYSPPKKMNLSQSSDDSIPEK